MEEIVLDQGRIRNPSFTDYLIPTALDMPEVVVPLIEQPEPGAPFGAKGVGEAPTVSARTPAVVAAIRDASGIAVARCPVRPQDLAPAVGPRAALPLKPSPPGDTPSGRRPTERGRAVDAAPARGRAVDSGTGAPPPPGATRVDDEAARHLVVPRLAALVTERPQPVDQLRDDQRHAQQGHHAVAGHPRFIPISIPVSASTTLILRSRLPTVCPYTPLSSRSTGT